MYKIYVDSNLFCNSETEDTYIIDPVVTLEANTAGTFTFTIPPEHPFYDMIQPRTSIVKVVKDGDILFQGTETSETKDMFGQKSVVCDGELSYLNDSVLRPYKYTNQTVLSLLTSYINQHNQQVDSWKQFEIGNVTVSSTDKILRYTNNNTTMEELVEDFIEDFGGYFRVRYEGKHKYLDYLANSPRLSDQKIQLGVNILNYESNLDNADICTQLIPLGATIENAPNDGLEHRITIGTPDYLVNQDAVNRFGKINKTMVWDDVTTQAALKSKGTKWLKEEQFDNITVTVNAIDLGVLGDKKQFRVLDQVEIISKPHGMDKVFVLERATYNLNAPENDSFEFGGTTGVSLSGKIAQATKAIKKTPSTSDILTMAQAQATAMIAGGSGGYVKIDTDVETKQPYRILIMDAPLYESATNIIQINKNGIGFSTDGGKTYRNAWTIDGNLVADFIHGGTLSIGGEGNSKGAISVVDAKGNIIGVWGKDGLTQTATYDDFDGNKHSVESRLASQDYNCQLMITDKNVTNNTTSTGFFSGSGVSFNGPKGSGGFTATGWDVQYGNEATQMHSYTTNNTVDRMQLEYRTSGVVKAIYGKNQIILDDNKYPSATICRNLFNADSTWLTYGSDFYCSASGALTVKSLKQTSDRNAKENIEYISSEEAEKVLRLEPVTFDFKEEYGGDKNNVGFIAQDVEEIYPHLVSTGETKALDYSGIIPYLVKYVQNQDKRIKELEDKINGFNN